MVFVCPSAWISAAPAGPIFVKFYRWYFDEKPIEKLQICLKSEKIWELDMKTRVCSTLLAATYRMQGGNTENGLLRLSDEACTYVLHS
jgi:hypothetical protein